MANVARLDLEPMSPGRSASGNSSGGGKRSKSGEFASVSDMEATAGPKASKPVSMGPKAPDIDAGWEASENPSYSTASASAQALAPKRVISIGPSPTNELARGESPQHKSDGDLASSAFPREKGEPAPSGLQYERRRQSEPVASNAPVSAVPAETKSDISLLNRRSREIESKSKDTQSTPKPANFSKGVDSSTLKKLLTDGPESDFDLSDIARLVTNVMGSQPPLPTSGTSKTPAFPTVSSAPIVSTRESAPPPSSATLPTSTATGNVAFQQSGNISEGIMEPDGWDVPIDEPAAEEQATVQTAKPEQNPVKSEASFKRSEKPATESRHATEKPRSKAEKKLVISATSKLQVAPEGFESGLSGEFFAISAAATAHGEVFHEHDELIDERHMRSISPEVRARRARYRIIVLVLFVGLTLLLAAAIALKLLHKH